MYEDLTRFYLWHCFEYFCNIFDQNGLQNSPNLCCIAPFGPYLASVVALFSLFYLEYYQGKQKLTTYMSTCLY